MRWFVEISSLGPSPTGKTTLCVEAPQWQPALQKARALRGDDGALSGFSIELLDDGYRAIDPASRLRYIVRRAPDDAALTNGTAAAAPSSDAAAPPQHAVAVGPSARHAPEPPRPPAPPAKPSSQRGRTVAYESHGAAVVEGAKGKPDAAAPAAPPRAPPRSTRVYESTGAASVNEPPAKPPPQAIASAPMAAHAPSPVRFEIVSKREDAPTERSPLTYREYVYAVAPGTSEEAATELLRERFAEIRAALERVSTGKLVNLAVFDHAFKGRPQRRPIATLTWKDWRSSEPEIQYPARTGVDGRSSPSGRPAAQPVPSAPATTRSASAEPMPPKEPARQPAPAIEAIAKTVAAPVEPPAPPRAPPAPQTPPSSRDDFAPPVSSAPPPPSSIRLSGDDLITELFEACSDLHFLRDSLEGADFVLSLALEKLPCEVGLISLFDINRREFVVVRQVGGGRSVLLQRQPERAPAAHTAMRSHRAAVFAEAENHRDLFDDRWKTLGITLRSLICAPVELGGRYLGLIELANPLDENRFTKSDGHAMTYIGQQFAEFVASRGIVIDQEHVLDYARRARR